MKTFLTANWQNLIMVNYEIDPSYLQPYLPKGVELDFYQGKTYISLVGFLFKNTRIFKIPIPIYGTFEEINLRFYVVKKEGLKIKRGVVFINETVPSKAVAWLANKLYKEHYTTIPTEHTWKTFASQSEIEYKWKVKKNWNSLNVTASNNLKNMTKGSMEEFIFEHYFGFTKVNQIESIEYKINHQSWQIKEIKNYLINCNFKDFYGNDFEILDHTKPHSVMLAEGSDVSIDWKRKRF